jgi:hypothetical protein
MAGLNPLKPISVRINTDGFEATETFSSTSDANTWKQMVETTLDHRAKANFDLRVYSAGLATSVRTYGGTYTKEAWLNVRVPPELWTKGLPVPLDVEAMFKDVLWGDPLQPKDEYRKD